LMHGI